MGIRSGKACEPSSVGGLSPRCPGTTGGKSLGRTSGRSGSQGCSVEGTRERVRLEAGRLGRRLRHSARRKAVEAWARRGRSRQVPGSAFPAGRGERGLDRPGGPSGADQGPGQRPQPKPGSWSCGPACHLPQPLRTGEQCGPVGISAAFGADWSCLCLCSVSSVKLLGLSGPQVLHSQSGNDDVEFTHRCALAGTSLPSQVYPGAAPAGGHVWAWPQAGLTAEKRADPILGPHGSLTVTCVLILPDQVQGLCRQQ